MCQDLIPQFNQQCYLSCATSTAAMRLPCTYWLKSQNNSLFNLNIILLDENATVQKIVFDNLNQQTQISIKEDLENPLLNLNLSVNDSKAAFESLKLKARDREVYETSIDLLLLDSLWEERSESYENLPYPNDLPGKEVF